MGLRVTTPWPSGGEHERQASFLVVEADSAADATRLMERDPYCKAGVWETMTVREFKASVGQWAPAAQV